MLQRLQLNTESALMACVGVLALLGAAAAQWWHLLGLTEPLYFKLCRALCLAMAIAVLYGIFVNRRVRTGLLLASGFIALFMPLLVTVGMTSLDADRVDTAVAQLDSTAQLANNLKSMEVNTEVAWTDTTQIAVQDLGRDDYTFIDGCASVWHFGKLGFPLSLIAGVCLLVAAWTANSAEASAVLRRRSWLFAACGGAYIVIVSVPQALGFYEWNAGRRDQAAAQYAGALYHYKRAQEFDHRLKYDYFFHFNIGRLDAELNRRDQPDYWAWTAETYYRAGSYERAVLTYDAHVPDPRESPALAARDAQMLYMTGARAFNSGNEATATQRFIRALQLQPTNLDYAYALALTETHAGDYGAAIKAWKSIIINNENVGLYRSKFFVSNIAYRKAITARAWAHMGWCYFKQNDIVDALACHTNSVTGDKTPLPTMDSSSPIKTWIHS